MHVFTMVACLFLFASFRYAQTTPFDVRQATVSSIHSSLSSGLTTCRGTVSAFLGRIEHFKPPINAIISLNAEALAIAESLDKALSQRNATGPLFIFQSYSRTTTKLFLRSRLAAALLSMP